MEVMQPAEPMPERTHDGSVRIMHSGRVSHEPDGGTDR